MAKGRKTGGRDFKPGNKASKGGIAHPKEVKEAAKLTKVRIQALLGKYCELSVNELKKKVKDNDMPAIEAWVAQVFLQGIIEADHVRLNFLLDRTIGKVTEKVEVKLPKPMMIERPGGGTVLLGHSEDKIIDVSLEDE